jgi:hypothetical protein
MLKLNGSVHKLHRKCSVVNMTIFTTLNFLHTLQMDLISKSCYIALGSKGSPETNTLAYWVHV